MAAPPTAAAAASSIMVDCETISWESFFYVIILVSGCLPVDTIWQGGDIRGIMAAIFYWAANDGESDLARRRCITS